MLAEINLITGEMLKMASDGMGMENVLDSLNVGQWLRIGDDVWCRWKAV